MDTQLLVFGFLCSIPMGEKSQGCILQWGVGVTSTAAGWGRSSLFALLTCAFPFSPYSKRALLSPVKFLVEQGLAALCC